MRPYEQAKKYVGVPFRHRGRIRPNAQTGHPGALDCLGLLVVTAQDLGLEVFDKELYGREPWRDGLQKGLRQNCGEPILGPLEPDYIILMRLHPDQEPSHVGILAPYLTCGLGIIHTYGEVGRVVFHRLNAYRHEQIVEVYTWPAKS